MGWTFGWDRLKELIAERTRNSGKPEETEWVCLAKCVRGNVRFSVTLWKVWEIRRQGVPVDRFIALDLIRCYKGKGGFGEWGV
jgi:hypothetical protein